MKKSSRLRLSLADNPRFFLTWAAVFCLVVLFLPAAAAAQPTGYQEYYVLGYEEHIWRASLQIYEGPDNDIPGRICSTVSLVATADHQVIYYDHWEDGYEADLLNPIQSTTEIFGDGNLANGGQGSDVLLAGDAINLVSDQNLTGPTAIHGYVPVDPSRNPAYLRYDGGDHVFSSGGPVDLTHAMWPLDNSWIGDAWEVYSRQAYADAYSYRLPIGEDLYAFGGGDTGRYGDFRNVILELGAFQDNTTVEIDNGADVINLTLDRGEAYSSLGYINSTPAPAITIHSSTTIYSNKPTQVGLATGADSPSGDGYQGRSYIVLSDLLWGSDYVVPVPSGSGGHPAEIYLSNPNDYPITIHAFDVATQTTFVISPSQFISSTVPYSTKRGSLGYVPADSAARFTSPDGVFGIVVAADTSDIVFDWGFSGIPANFLTSDYYASWAPGTTDLSDNGSPVWVTPLNDGTTFYVDYSPLDGVVDETFTLNVLQQRRIFDRIDNDNTGMHIWATAEFAMAWGEDPNTAGNSTPYLDLGVTTLPLLQRWLDPVLTLDKTAQPTILTSPGQVTFTLAAQAFNAPLSNVDLSDTLPISWSYVPGSSQIVWPDGSETAWEPSQNGRHLFWDLSTALDVNQQLALTFRAAITSTGGVTLTAFDGFESGDYSGGANWAGDWQESGDDGNPAAGDVRLVQTGAPYSGNYHLRIRGSNNAITRSLNLEPFVAPLLQFVRRVEQIEVGDDFYLDVFDGLEWTPVLTWTNGDLEGQTVHETVNLSPYADSSTALRFRSGVSVSGDDTLYLDQIQIFDGLGVSINRGEAIGKDEYSGTLFNPTDEASVYISPLHLEKSVSHTQIGIAGTLVYTISYANLGSAITATNVVLRDTVPVQHVTVESISNGGHFDPASGELVWTWGALAPGTGGVVTFTVRVKDFVENGTLIVNTADVSSDQTRAGSNEVRTTVLAPDITFSKTGPTAAALGQVITYTISFQNEGGLAGTNVVISDVLSPSLTYVPGSLALNLGGDWLSLTDAPDGDRGAFISPTVIVTPGVVAPDLSGQVRFRVQVGDTLPPDALILNSAALDRDLDIPRQSNTVVTRISDLLLTKRAETRNDSEQPIVAPTGLITYTLIYENVSPTTSQTNVFVQERVPDLTALVSGSVFGGDSVEYSWDNGATWSATLPITPVTHLRWYDAVLPAATQASAGFTVQVNPTLPPNTTIQNVAYITSTEMAAFWDEWLVSNEVSVDTVDLWLKKNASATVAPAGEILTYTLFYGNRGSADAVAVQIADLLPAGTTYRAGSIWGAGADDTLAPWLVWDVFTVTAGSGGSTAGYAVQLAPDLTPGTFLTNTAAFSSPWGVEVSNVSTVLITAPILPQLSLNKSVSAGQVTPGEPFTYTLVVTNDGGMAYNLWVSDVLPADTAFVSCGGAACGLADNTVNWSLPNLSGSGASLTLTLSVLPDEGLANGWLIVNSSYGAVADGIALVSGPPVTTTISVAVLNLNKWAFPLEVFAGSRLDYTLRVENSGGRATQLVVSDTLPAHTTFGGCDCSLSGLATGSAEQVPVFCGATFVCYLQNDTVVWRVDDLMSGRALQMTFWVTTEPTLSEGTLIVNQSYTLTAEHVAPLVGSVPVTTPVHQLLVTISKTAHPNPVTTGQQLLYTITLQNPGSALNNLTITDLLPVGTSFVTCGGALCELDGGLLPYVRWWIPSLAAGSAQDLTMRVLVGDVGGDRLINAFYGIWVPAASQRVAGVPVEVAVINPYSDLRYIYLPLVLRDYPP